MYFVNKTWRWPLGLLLMGAMGAQAQASDVTKIVSINETYDPEHLETVDVHPGDVVLMKSDVFSGNEDDLAAQNKDVEDFTWSADDKADDVCDASNKDSCLDSSNFEVADDGVNFYVPYNIGESLTVTVKNTANPDQLDTVVLKNVDFKPTYIPPTEVITSSDDYHYDEFDTTHRLAGLGRWVTGPGGRYWVPTRQREDWVPYQNGYWTWVEGEGETWMSNDPWGDYTDHYGYWRHHGVHGWVWFEFPDHKYRPHTVTWVYTDTHVGWYPYYDGYKDGYHAGASAGFDDGYWYGYKGGHYYGDARYHYNQGFTCVEHRNFHRENIFDVRIGSVEISIGFFREGYSHEHYGYHPGDRDLGRSRDWMNQRTGRWEETRIRERRFGEFTLRTPEHIHRVPDYYRVVPGREHFQRPISVGAVYRHGNDGHEQIVRATLNGRGLSTPPRFVNPNTHKVEYVPARAREYGRPNPNNPGYRPPTRPPEGRTPEIPHYRPGNQLPHAPPPKGSGGTSGGWSPRPGTGGGRPRPGEGGTTPPPSTGGGRPRPGEGGTTPPPSTGGGRPRPGEGGTTPPPSTGGGRPRPGEGGTTPPPSTGGGRPRPGEGGTTPPPSTGGGRPRPGEGGTTPPPSTGGGRPRPGEGGTTPPPSTGGGRPRPGEGGTTPPPSTGGGRTRPGEGGTTPPPSTGGGRPRPGEGGTTPPPSTGGGRPRPGEGGTTPPPSTGGGRPRPGEGGTTPPPSTGGGRTRPGEGGRTPTPPAPRPEPPKEKPPAPKPEPPKEKPPAPKPEPPKEKPPAPKPEPPKGNPPPKKP